MSTDLRTLRLALVGLALIGFVIAGYLTFSALTDTSLLCSKGSPCEIVRESAYSEVMGVPVALIGLLGYLIMGLILLLETRSTFFEDKGPMLFFGVSLIGFLYSAYLTYLEVVRIHALCPYCVASAVIMTLLFALSVVRVLKTIQA